MKLRAERKFRLLAVLALLAGLAAVVASTAALAPHDDGEGRSCLVCKAGSQPFQLASSSGGSAPPLRTVAAIVLARETASLSDTVRLGSPRAPPV